MKSKIFYLLYVSIFSLISCKKNEVIVPENTATDSHIITKVQFKSSQMLIGTPKWEDFQIFVKASGELDVPPQNKAVISTFIGGYVKSTALLVGDKVSKGQALLTLENTEFIDLQKEYLEVAEQMTYLKSEFARQKTLFGENISSEKNFLKAESDFKRTQALYRSLKEKLNLLHINPKLVEQGNIISTITLYAPISGKISVMNAQLGMYAAPSSIILEIVDTNELHIELSVFEKDILKVNPNQTILFTIPEVSKKVYTGKVHLIGQSIEGNERMINVHGDLNAKMKQQLVKGMFTEANIVVGTKKAWSVPIDALITEENKNYLFLLEKESNEAYYFKKMPVQIGSKTENAVEIFTNEKIKPTSKLLLKGSFDITE